MNDLCGLAPSVGLADDADEVDPLVEDDVDTLADDDEVGPAPPVGDDGVVRVIAPGAVALGVVGAVRLGGLGEAGTAASPGTAVLAGTVALPDAAGSGDTA